MKLHVELGKQSYPIYIENNILSQAASYIRDIFSGKRIMIISDDNVYPLYGETLTENLSVLYECHHLVLPVDLRLFLLEGLGVELERLLRALP